MRLTLGQITIREFKLQMSYRPIVSISGLEFKRQVIFFTAIFMRVL